MASIDPTELGRIYREQAPALRLYARQWADNAEDLVQDAFVKLAQQANAPTQCLPWLYRVVRNEALANHRGAARRRKRETTTGRPIAWFDSVDDRIDAQEVSRLLQDLPIEFRETIVARLWGGLTFAEVAELAGCSLATAQRRYQTGLMELRERLEGRWMNHHRTPTI
jgi:RNA polymerase sigma-70 factor (ECF subfamily)